MGASAVLRPGTVKVDPGRDARCQIYVRNTGQIVDQFLLSVVGDVDGWVELRPELVNLLPNEEAVVDLILSPPMSPEVLAGDHPFAIRIVSREDISGSLVYEGMATVSPFVQLNAEIVPHTSRGRWRGRHTLVVDNVSNFPLKVDPQPVDPDALLNFRVRPKAPLTKPGTATMIRVRPRPVKVFWRGAEKRVPFRVDVVPDTGRSISVEAALTQKAILPRRLFVLLAMLVMLAFILLIVITTLLQKQPVSMAGPSPITPSTSPSSSSALPTPSAVVPPAGAVGAPVPAPAPVGGGGGGSGGGSTSTTANRPASFTITATASAIAGNPAQLFSYVIPTGTSLRLVSVHFTDQQHGPGSMQIRLDSTPLASFDLFKVDNTTYRFPSATTPVAHAGQRVTLAVSCSDTAAPCSLTAAFSVGAAS